MQNILLVRPVFPDSKNSVFRIPIGLCKISSWRKSLGDTVYYIEGTYLCEDIPYNDIDVIYITSMFTYWSSYVIDAVNFYKRACPNAKIICGGIYASISPNHLKENCPVDEVIVGVINEAEKFLPDYSILPTHNEDINNTQIIWTSRGCRRKCDHCFVNIIEPDIHFDEVDTIRETLYANTNRKNVLLYDNSLMQHPELHSVFEMFIEGHKRHRFKYNCTQGIDGRMMKEWEEKGVPVAKMMKEAGFYDLRFSYDWSFQKDSVYYCINKFEEAGYKRNEMQIFIVINSKDSPKTIENRYWEVYGVGCQIHSDRFRPSDWYYDNFHKGGENYFINTEHGWTNTNIRGMLRFMVDLNYANRMNCLYSEVNYIRKSKGLNKGKSSSKLSEYISLN